jgi:hypothetical protein
MIRRMFQRAQHHSPADTGLIGPGILQAPAVGGMAAPLSGRVGSFVVGVVCGVLGAI